MNKSNDSAKDRIKRIHDSYLPSGRARIERDFKFHTYQVTEVSPERIEMCSVRESGALNRRSWVTIEARRGFIYVDSAHYGTQKWRCKVRDAISAARWLAGQCATTYGDEKWTMAQCAREPFFDPVKACYDIYSEWLLDIEDCDEDERPVEPDWEALLEVIEAGSAVFETYWGSWLYAVRQEYPDYAYGMSCDYTDKNHGYWAALVAVEAFPRFI